jgi:hypothetical protein
MTPAKVCRTGTPGYIGSQTMNLATGRLRLLHKQSDAPTTRLYLIHLTVWSLINTRTVVQVLYLCTSDCIMHLSYEAKDLRIFSENSTEYYAAT